MKTLLSIFVLCFAMLSLHAGPPQEIIAAYKKEFPNTGQMSVVAQATVNGYTYCAIYGADQGEGGESGVDTEAAFQVLPNGSVRKINGNRWVRPFSAYIRDPEVVDALLRDALNREQERLGGRIQLQQSLMSRQQMSLENALNYKRNSYSLPPDLMVTDNKGVTSLASSHSELR